MSEALVSVIIPAHNKENFLEDSVNSVLGQTFKDFEIIIVNNTADYICKDARIRCFGKENTGLNSARNFGIRNSKGKYIALLDSGDIWKAEKLEKQVKILNKKSEIGLVYCGTSFIDKNKNPIGQNPLVIYKGYVFNRLIMYNFLYSSSVALFRKDCLEKTGLFDESLNSMTDWEFYLKFSINYKFWGIEEFLVQNKISEEIESNNFEFFEHSGFKVLNRIFQRNDIETKHVRLINTAYAMRYKYIGKKCFENQHFKRSRGFFHEALKRDPSISFRSDVLIYYLLSYFPEKKRELLKSLKNYQNSTN